MIIWVGVGNLPLRESTPGTPNCNECEKDSHKNAVALAIINKIIKIADENMLLYVRVLDTL